MSGSSVAIGVDWSGSWNAAPWKLWAASLAVMEGGSALSSLAQPFRAYPNVGRVVQAFPMWLDQQTFDAAGLDFCFGLERSQMVTLALPTTGPADLGVEIRRRYADADTFKAAVGPERKRRTDIAVRAPFAPTNLRMYRQTFWGLCALAGIRNPVTPWRTGDGAVIEVLPAHVAEALFHRCRYKGDNASSGRSALVSALRGAGIAISQAHSKALVDDGEGDALDAVLAAVAAAHAVATGFVGAPDSAAPSGEGWIYSI